jgi:hypothetical protein
MSFPGAPVDSMAGIDPRALDVWSPLMMVGHAGSALWLVAYVFAVVRSHRDRAYGIPLIAVALNFSWEILGAFVFPVSHPFWHTAYRAWLVVDLAIVWQVLRYGRALQADPFVRRFFYPIFGLAFVFGLAGQYAFVASYPDRQGIVVAFGINLVMSVAFFPMYLARRGHRRGISVGTAWAKLAGTALQAAQCFYLVPWLNPGLGSPAFLWFLAAAIFLLDLAYALLVTGRWLERRPSDRTEGAAALTAVP